MSLSINCIFFTCAAAAISTFALAEEQRSSPYIKQDATRSFLRAISPFESEQRDFTLGRIYQVVSSLSGKCLDVTDHSFASGAQLQQWNCTGKSNQKFKIQNAGDSSLKLVAQESGLTLTVAENSFFDGGAIVQSNDFSDGRAQMSINATHDQIYNLKFVHSGKCLDIEGPSVEKGARVHQWECHGGVSQDWRLVEQTSGLGKQAWKVPSTSVQKDKFGRIYRQTYTPGSSIIRVNVKDGSDLWAFKTDSYSSIFPNCNDQTQTYVTGDQSLYSLDPGTGKTLWTYDSGDSGTSFFALFCVTGYNSLFLLSSADNGTFRSIEKATGRLRWTYRGPGYLSFVGKKGQNVFISSYKDGKQTILDLESGTGRVKWQRPLKEGEWITATAQNELLINRTNSIEKINPETGNEQWTYKGLNNGSNIYFDWNAGGYLYVNQGRDLRRLKSDDGSTLWFITMPQNSTSRITSHLILANGDILVRSANASQNTASSKYYNLNGQQIWSNNTATGNAQGLEDASSKLYYLSGDTVWSIDRTSGAIVWQFSREFPVTGEHVYSVETIGTDTYVVYGSPAPRYPPMGVLRLDAASGALQWDNWVGATTSLVGLSENTVIANLVMGTGTVGWKR